MASWSGKRKIVYALLALVALVVAIGLPSWKLFYVAPSCTDHTQNGDEQGIDCGGSCTKVCSSEFLSLPSASWVRFREVAPKTYNVAAYVVNPNPKAGASSVPYTLTLLDSQGISLLEKHGTFDVPPGRNTLIFEGPLVMKDQQPIRAIVDFDHDPEWFVLSDTLSAVSVVDKSYTDATTSSALSVTVRNSAALPVKPFYVYAILKDADGTVVDFSKTIVDGLAPGESAIAPFTWTTGHAGQVISIEVLIVPE
jgi:hypothetical protein